MTFPDDPEFEGMPKNAEDRRFMAMPAYLGGRYQMAGMKWYGSNMENKKKGLPRSILMMMLNDKDTGGTTCDDVGKPFEFLPNRGIPVLAANIWRERMRNQSQSLDRVLWEKLLFVPLSV